MAVTVFRPADPMMGQQAVAETIEDGVDVIVDDHDNLQIYDAERRLVGGFRAHGWHRYLVTQPERPELASVSPLPGSGDDINIGPGMGDPVLYRLSEQDAHRVNNEPTHLRNPAEAGDVYPAIVVRTWGNSLVNLHVLVDGVTPLWCTSRAEGDRDGQWFRR